MDIEIIFDPISHALDLGLVINENHEILPDGEWVSWCKRISGIDDLFVYRHKEAGTFVLSKWIYHPKKDGIGIAMELEIMSDHPDKYPVDLPSAHSMRNRLKSNSGMAEQMKKGIRDRAKAKRQQTVENAEERHRVADWLHRKGNVKEAAALRQKTNWKPENSPEFEQFKQDIKNKAKGRIITGGI